MNIHILLGCLYLDNW